MNFPTAADHDPLIAEVLVGEEELRGRVVELGAEISRDYAGLDPVLVGVLKGAVFFIADLVRTLTVPCEIDFMAVSSYGNTTDSSGVVRILKDLDAVIEGRHVLIVEDIVDSGLTLSYLQDILRARNPRSLRTACLLNKPSRRLTDVKVEYIGFTIEDRFVVGYGLDFAEQYRNLPHIAVMNNDMADG